MSEGRHPYFNDRRAAYWFPSLSDALEDAGRTGRRVLLQIGKLSCGGTRTLIEKTLLKDEIAEFVNAHFACVAASTDALDPEVEAILAALPKREPTPVCVYLAPDGGAGRVLHSTAGGRPAAVFLQDMTEAIGRK